MVHKQDAFTLNEGRRDKIRCSIAHDEVDAMLRACQASLIDGSNTEHLITNTPLELRESGWWLTCGPFWSMVGVQERVMNHWLVVPETGAMAVFRMKRGEVVMNSTIVSPGQYTAATMRSTSGTPIGTPIPDK